MPSVPLMLADAAGAWQCINGAKFKTTGSVKALVDGGLAVVLEGESASAAPGAPCNKPAATSGAIPTPCSSFTTITFATKTTFDGVAPVLAVGIQLANENGIPAPIPVAQSVKGKGF